MVLVQYEEVTPCRPSIIKSLISTAIYLFFLFTQAHMWGAIYGLVLQHVVLPAGQEEECVDCPLLLCEPFIHTYLALWSEPGKLFV